MEIFNTVIRKKSFYFSYSQMDCIRSLQKSSASLDKQLSTLGTDTHARESEIANSLEQMGDCLKDAQTERRRLEEKMNNE